MAKEQMKEEVVEKVQPENKPEKKPETKTVKPEVPEGAKVTKMDNGTVRVDY